MALAVFALPLRADPPPLVVGAAGPGVEIGGFAQTTLVSASGRGLSVGFTDLSELIPPVDGGTEFIPNPGTGIPGDAFRDAEAYRVTRTAETVEVAADGGARVQVRIGGSGAVLVSATGPTLEAARAAALADAALDGIRARIVGSDVVTATPTVTTTEVNSSALTGRDAYVTTVIVFGPEESIRTRGGNVGLCTDFVTGCDGGTQVTVDDDITFFNTFTLNDLYVTDTLTRTATTVQEYFLNLTLDEGSDPPPLMVGPVVQTREGPKGSTLIVSERGLNIPFEDLAEVRPEYIENGVTFALGGDVYAYAPDAGVEVIDEGVFVTSTAFGYTLTTRTVTATEAVDGGVRVQARVGQAGPTVGSALAATLDEAVAAVLALPQVLAVAFERTEVVANGTSQTTVQETAKAITGRDTYVSEGIVIFGADSEAVGNLGRCTVAATDCEGGTDLQFGINDTLALVYDIQDLYVTETITDVVTTVQEYFLNLIVAGGDGAPHAGAQATGFEAGEGFLARLEDEAGVPAGSGVTTSTSGSAPGAAGRLRFFAGASGGAGSYDQIGTIAESDWNASGLTGGFAYALSPEWTVGAGVEAGRWSWEGGGSEAEGDTRKVGLFAAWSRGPWQVTLAGFAGQHDVETEDALGVTAEYKADVRGLSVAVAHDFAAGAWTVAPHAALRWVQWDAPQVTDSAGGVIAAVDAVQVRPELGLTARRSIALKRGTMDLGLDARVWTVEGDRVAVTSAGFVTDGPETGRIGGSLGLTAGWRLAPATVLTARIETRFSEEGASTTAGLGLRVRF